MTESERNLKLKSQINTTRLVCVIIILILIIVSNWVGDTYTDETLTSYFSFASTITSIILSVIAIILSVFSADSVSQVISRFRDLCDDIREVPEQIDQSVLKIEKITSNLTQIEEKIDGIPSQVELSINKLTTFNRDINKAVFKLSEMLSEIKQDTLNLNEKMNRTESLLVSGKQEKDLPKNSSTMTADDIWKDIIKSGSVAGNLLLYALVKSKEVEKEFTLNKFIDATGLSEHEDYLWGYLIALSASGLVYYGSVDYVNTTPFNVIYVKLHEYVIETINSYKQNEASHGLNICEVVQKIDVLFN